MAEQTNMLDYIDDKANQLDFDGDYMINGDKEAHVFELDFTLEVENPDEIEIENQNGDLTNEGKITYKDSILFYDETRLNGQDYADQYLTVIPFEGKKGIQQSYVDGVFTYLQDVLADGESNLMDFLTVEASDDTFSLTWDEKSLDEILQNEDQKDSPYLPYPRY